jgi:hypothetical protein
VPYFSIWFDNDLNRRIIAFYYLRYAAKDYGQEWMRKNILLHKTSKLYTWGEDSRDHSVAQLTMAVSDLRSPQATWSKREDAAFIASKIPHAYVETSWGAAP